MKTVTLSLANRQAVKQRALDAFSAKRREFPFDAVGVDFVLKAA